MALRLLAPVLRRKVPVYMDPVTHFFHSSGPLVPYVPPSSPPPSMPSSLMLPPPPPLPPLPPSNGDDDDEDDDEEEDKEEDKEEEDKEEEEKDSKPKQAPNPPNPKPKSESKRFRHLVKLACWEKAAMVAGRDPRRWRKDKYGNIVCKKQSSGYGMTAFQYDHKVPISSGVVDSSLDNCEILLAILNNIKSDKNPSLMEIVAQSPHYSFTEAELDDIEINEFFNLSKPVETLAKVNADGTLIPPKYKLICKSYKNHEVLEVVLGVSTTVSRLRACDADTEQLMRWFEKKPPKE